MKKIARNLFKSLSSQSLKLVVGGTGVVVNGGDPPKP